MYRPFRTLIFCAALLMPATVVSAKTESRAVPVADLSKQQASWLAVGGGMAVAPPVETDYGFAVFTDGRMISAFGKKGTCLWKKAVNGRQTPYLAAFGDFLYAITADKKLNLINPSGLTLWTADLGFAVTEAPFVGRDGRVFVRGKNALACYGLNGIRKWIMVTGDAGAIPLLAFDDGSVLVSSRAENGATSGIRVSPFGEILETITFTGNIIAASQCAAGILISQDDGTIALCGVRNGAADTVWSARAQAGIRFRHICVAQDGAAAAFLGTNGKSASLSLIAIATGDSLAQIDVGGLQIGSLSYLRATAAGFFLSDEKRAFECTPEGSVVWQATLPPKKTWNFVYYTAQNYLILCQRDWTIRAFLMTQKVEKKTAAPPQKERPSYLTAGTAQSTIDSLNLERLSAQTLDQIAAGFAHGDYGRNEAAWLADIKHEMQAYFLDSAAVRRNAHDGVSYFTEHPVYTQSLVRLMAQSGTDTFSAEFATLLATEKEPSLIALAVREAGRQGYDGDGSILAEMESLAAGRIAPREQNTLKILCDATYEICRFMGRPALVTKGKAILTYLFFPQFDKATHDYARKTLARLKDLGI